MKLIVSVLLILFGLSSTPAQENIRKTHEALTRIKSDLINNHKPDEESIEIMTREYGDSRNERLSGHIGLFNQLYKSGAGNDTLLSVIRVCSDEFYRMNGKNIFELLYPVNKTKFLMFTTSISCECTINMCRDYETAIISNSEFQAGRASLLIVDTYTDEELAGRYNVSFVPCLLVISADGKELHRYTREENIKEKLKYLSLSGGE